MQVIMIIIFLIIIIFLLSENFTNSDTTKNVKNIRKSVTHNVPSHNVPPHIEHLKHKQQIPQKINLAKNYIPPNYGKKSQENTPDNTKMAPGNIYRMNTGRDAYQEEQFVSIYDANFGGMLGTNMGL